MECNPYSYLIDFERLEILFHNDEKVVNSVLKTFYRFNNLIKSC